MTQIAIRKSGGANIVSLPKAVLKSLGLQTGSSLDLSIVNDQIILTPVRAEVPTLESLLEGSLPEQYTMTEEDQAWVSDGITGRELI
tara:strand:- start:365 stop:625 length:261 start_codon:yes stop_codon:yes gene_type:complete